MAPKPAAAPREAVYLALDGHVMTPEEVKALAVDDRINARIRGERNQGIKEGRQRERAELLSKLGTQTLEDASQLGQIRAERDARPSRAEAQEHGKHRFHQGLGLGALIGAAATVAIGAALVPMLTQSTVAGVAVGSQVERQSNNVERLDALDTSP